MFLRSGWLSSHEMSCVIPRVQTLQTPALSHVPSASTSLYIEIQIQRRFIKHSYTRHLHRHDRNGKPLHNSPPDKPHHDLTRVLIQTCPWPIKSISFLGQGILSRARGRDMIDVPWALGMGFNRAGFFGRHRIGRSGGYSSVGRQHHDCNATWCSRNIKEAKTKQQEVGGITRWKDFNNSVEFRPFCLMVEGRGTNFGRKTTRKESINLLANSLKTVGKLALKTWHFKDMRRHYGAR